MGSSVVRSYGKVGSPLGVNLSGLECRTKVGTCVVISDGNFGSYVLIS